MDAPSTIRCYRGVPDSHIYYQDALQGIARPRGGPATPIQHNQGFTDSEYTSWTTSYQIALRKALNSNTKGQGIVLQKDFDEAEIILSPDTYAESEVFICGLVTDALAIRVP